MDCGRRPTGRSKGRRVARLLLASLALLAGGCASATRAPQGPGGAASSSERATMREAQGDALVRRGDFGAAIAEYREAIRLDPELGSAHASLGSALAHQGEPEQALAAFRDASRLEPHNAGVWLQLSHLYEVSGRGADALRSLEMGVEANPDDAGLLNQVAWLLATAEDPALRDPAKALGYAQRAVAASGGADANILDTLAEAHFANGEFAEAIEVEERALAIAPGIEVFHDQLEKFRAAAGSR